ncbi:MAG: asparaginase [Hylemonella sp.]|jgi:L-asparaginase|uniref:asparaginase n=1 Tax=Hylemonella sp. TaxID=2066020 RepID=UPI003918A338
MQAVGQKIVVLGTGGTIAGLAQGTTAGRYRAAQKSVDELLVGVAVPTGVRVQVEQVAQIDSKDMDLTVWQALLRACRAHLDQADVRGLVITHGTDTLEETAWLLQALLAPHKPVVLTCAMRPADAPDADGPRNLADALAVAADPDASGVLAVCAGRILGAQEVQKVHSSWLDAFSSGEAGDIGRVQASRVQWLRDRPVSTPRAALESVLAATALPRVEIVLSHAAASGAAVDALVDPDTAVRHGAASVRGLVLAGTGSGTLHREIEAATQRAQAAGVRVVRSTRCADGWLQPRADDAIPALPLSPVKARLALMLDLLGR